MDICIKEKTDRRLKMIVSGVTPSFMNTIRRIIVAEIPKMAIDTVEFHLGSSRDEDGNEFESISSLFDEIIAHRLSLVPVPTDLSMYTFKDQCECNGEGCPNCEIMYTLNKRGPCTVYSGDLEPLGDPSLKVKEDLIPIVKLDKKQALLIYAIARLGTSQKHAKWQVATALGYKYYPEIVPHELSESEQKTILKVSPTGFFRMKKGQLEIADVDKIEPGKYGPWGHGASPDAAYIEIKGREDKFIFSLETDGSLTPKEVLQKALEIMEVKYNDFRQNISDL